MRHRVLCVGTNLQLQRLRQDLLQAAGYEVAIATTSAEAIVVIGEECYDAAILCESLPAAETAKLAHSLAMVSPSTVVFPLDYVRPSLAEYAPEMLLQCLRTLLRRREQQRAARIPMAG